MRVAGCEDSDPMKTLRAYSKSEDAYTDAAFLCGMGFEAVVFDERGFGGNMLGSSSEMIRIEMPDEQVSEAIDLLDRRHSELLPPSEPKASPIADVSLHKLLRVILCFDLAITILLLVAEDLFVVRPPAQVEEFLLTLSFSDVLWRFSYISYWPLLIVGMASNVLCLFYIRLGRPLFLLSLVWTIISQLGPPPVIFGPALGFMGGLQWTLVCMALCLMYWSPLKERFRA